jgi:MFS family permease
VIPRAVKGLSLVSFFNDIASEMVYPLLPAFITGTLGAGPLALGLLDRVADLASAFVKWWSGRLSDRPGWRAPLILVGYATAVLIRPVISLAGAAWQVIGFRVLDRVGKGLRTPPRDALIADVTPPELRGRAFGYHRAADHIGAMLGSVVAWAALEAGAYVPGVIGWSVAPGLAAVLILSVVLRDGRRGGGAKGQKATTGGQRDGGRASAPLSSPSAPLPLRPTAPLLALALLTGLQLPEALLLLRLQERGVALPLVPLVWGALHVVRSAASYPGGRLSDRVGPRVGIAAGGVLFAVVALALATGGGAVAAIGAFLAFGLVAGLIEPAERAFVAQLLPERLGHGFGTYHALVGLTALPAGLLLGAVYQQAGGPAALLMSAGAVTMAAGVWLVVARSR